MKLIGNHLINETVIAWANLDYTWMVEERRYKTQRSGLSTFDGGENVAHTGVYIRFMDGSNLTFDDALPCTADLRAWLTGEPLPAAPKPTDPLAEILAGLPLNLQGG
jgi:hypothetical protein